MLWSQFVWSEVCLVLVAVWEMLRSFFVETNLQEVLDAGAVVAAAAVVVAAVVVAWAFERTAGVYEVVESWALAMP